jgi:hypothetical protein
MKCPVILLISVFGGAALLAQVAEPPQELFKRLAPSVFVVEALDGSGAPVALGSAVALRPNEIVTNCHVAERGVTLRVKQGSRSWAAELMREDADNDICRLRVSNLQALPVKTRPSAGVAVGERVFAIGSPEGLELTFSEGVISGVRDIGAGVRLLQTTAAISHGSSGGGLFDAQGRLVGITTFYVGEAQNLNFAIPAEIASATGEPSQPGPSVAEVTLAPPGTRPPAAGALPASDLASLLPQVQEVATAMNLDVSRLKIEKWKADANSKQQSEASADSILRNLTTALPAILSQVQANPQSVAAAFRLYHDLSVLYDYFAGLTESAGAFGQKGEYEALAGDADNLEQVRRTVGEKVENLAASHDAEIARLRTAVAQAQAAAAAPLPPPKKIIVDDTEPPQPVHKKSAAKKPASGVSAPKTGTASAGTGAASTKPGTARAGASSATTNANPANTPPK